VPEAIDVIELERGRVGDDGQPTLRDAVISAFERETQEWLAHERPTWPRWLNALTLAPDTVALARDLGCRGVAVLWSSIDEPSMERAAASGLEVAAWTVRSLDDYRRLEELGVVAICAEDAALDG
jgi:glycerophosphoryl diester phosphodiesterase